MIFFRATCVILAVLLAAVALASIHPHIKPSRVREACFNTKMCDEGEPPILDANSNLQALTSPNPELKTRISISNGETESEQAVLSVANSYSNGGGFNWDSGSGTPEEIIFSGQRILSKAKRGTYCCGFTFTVVMRAASMVGLLKDKSVAQIRKFQQHWYAATPEAREKQQIFAMEWLGIGHEVPLFEARPGDFIRLWHGGSGHSVILVRWIDENGRKQGFEYRGTQGSTDGIGNRIEYLPGTPGHERGDFYPERTYAGRLNAPTALDSDNSSFIGPLLQGSKTFAELARVSRHPAYLIEESGMAFVVIAIGDNRSERFDRWKTLRLWRVGSIEVLDPVTSTWKFE